MTGDDTRLDLERDGRDWPNRESSRFVEAGGLRFHVQTLGAGPVVLLLHGTGASTHSWAGLAPLLAPHFTIVMPDMPGHGFTATPPLSGMSLPGMARSLSDLVAALGIEPQIVIGHSAGAAILIRMTLDGRISPRAIVSINGALLPFRGMAGLIFPPMARLLYLNSVMPRLVSWRAGMEGAVGRVLAGTGSAIERRNVELYERLFRNPVHVAGALSMMASWDLEPLVADLPRLTARLRLIACGNDRAVPADDAFRVRERLPAAQVRYVRGLGHLAHEERPDEIATIVMEAARAAAVVE